MEESILISWKKAWGKKWLVASSSLRLKPRLCYQVCGNGLDGVSSAQQKTGTDSFIAHEHEKESVPVLYRCNPEFVNWGLTTCSTGHKSPFQKS